MMRSRLLNFYVISALVLVGVSGAMTNSAANEALLEPAAIKAVMKRVADWQWAQPPRHNARDWTSGALYAGMMAWAELGDPTSFDRLRKIGEEQDWELGPQKYHADHHCVGQMYLELYERDRDPRMFKGVKERFDWILANPPDRSKLERRDPRWWWCDALFMAPPVWAKLYQITGDEKYLHFMDEEFKATTDLLYDTEENLYYRDTRYIGRTSAHGAKVFWSRGNAWVFGGLPRLLEQLPDDWATRPYYENIFRNMAAKLKAIQSDDGYWRSSLLDPEEHPMPETSGTGFFVYGLAWGINNGLLDETTYRPAMEKGWQALVAAVQPNGLLGWVQQIDAKPGATSKEMSEIYGVGAFLLAGSELYKTAVPKTQAKEEIMRPQPITFMKNGGWCWYQDPRAILHHDELIIGGLQGNGDGSAVVGVFDLAEMKIVGQTVVHENFGTDDHNAPVFYVRPDERLLTMYALHSKETTHYYRISEPGNALAWGEERRYEHDYPGAGNVTYMNFFPLSAEGKLYNFFRGIEFNPCYITSTDHGTTWGEPTHFIASELNGRHRPYARYAGNGVDTIHVNFTDGHPRQYGNSLYYAAFRDGRFYRANGTLIKDLKKEGPLRPSESDRIYEGGGEKGRGRALSALNSAWTSSIALDSEERPHVGYTLYLSNTDHRYRMAFWDGTQWVDREVAYAGGCLYDVESSYTGLITLDPVDPTKVVISTDVDPSTGADLGGVHEIYRARVGPNDDISTIRWKPVTRHSSARNLRPIILRDGTRRVILWLHGRYTTFRNYDVDVVGLVESLED